MWRPARQRKAVVAVVLAITAFGAFATHAAETKLLAACDATRGANDSQTLVCKLRANGFAEFQGATVGFGGGSHQQEGRFEPFDAERDGSTTAYIIQTLPAARRATMSQMADAVVTIAGRRDGKRRFAAYTFGENLTPIADSGVSRDAFVRQLIAISPATGPTHLYGTALAAVKALANETGARKALVILGDGTSDDTEATHEQVVDAARGAGVAIHVLGYYDDARQRSKFEALSRLAEDTGGYAAEVKQGANAKNDATKDIVTGRFLTDVIENGGTVTAALNGPAGERDVAITAAIGDGKTLSAGTRVTVPAAAPPPPVPSPEPPSVPQAEPVEGDDDFLIWPLAIGLMVLLGIGAVGGAVYGREVFRFIRWWLDSGPRAEPETATGRARKVPALAAPRGEPRRQSAGQGLRQPAREEDRRPAVYGWLETLDGDSARHPIGSTDVRVGRHRDNDICLSNDSISRRHALLRYDTQTQRVTITDLGAGNGVFVNQTRCTSRELDDGDTVELGEVRLRFRAAPGFGS